VNKDSVVGVILNLDQAIAFWTRCKEVEEKGYKLDLEERRMLLKSMRLGHEITLEDLRDLCSDKKTLVIKGKDNANPT
jgi:acetyl-CoA carboxylase beta subunit